MKKKLGKLIVIEGTDGSGKGTQTEKLMTRLHDEGYKVYMFSFPRYNTPTGKIIGGPYLGKSEIGESFFLDPTTADPKVISHYYAADRLAAKEEMKEALRTNDFVFCDRYVESNLAHQGAKLPKDELGNFVEYINTLEYQLNAIPQPDKVFFLHMPKDISLQLRQSRTSGDAHENDLAYLRKCEGTYQSLASLLGRETINCAETATKARSIDDIHTDLYNHVINL